MDVEQTVIASIPSQPIVIQNKKQEGAGKGLSKNDSVSLDMSEVYKSLTILGDKIVQKLNELMKDQLPNGIQSLKPEEQTPEKTADRIVSGVVGLLPAFAAQNKDLEGEELVNKFMEVVKGGVQKGYEEAVGILEALEAFKFDGVKSGIEETMRLVGEKLDAFAAQLIGSKGEQGVDGKSVEQEEITPEMVVD